MTVSRITSIKELRNKNPQADSTFIQRIGDEDFNVTLGQIDEWIAPARQKDFLAEIQERKAADNSLQTNIDTEAEARAYGDKTLQEHIDTEAESRKTADTELQSNIDAETASRKDADGKLQANIEAETAGRTEADNALSERIDANKEAIDVLNGTGEGSVAKSVADGIASVIAGADESLDTLKEISEWIYGHESSASKMNAAIQANKTAIQEETSARQGADETLQANIDAESAERKEADTLLQANIEAEAEAREEADATLQGNIEAEATKREESDASLQANIGAETNARKKADEELESIIGNEATARITADENLQENIENEAASREEACSTLQTNIDTLAQFLANEAETRAKEDADTLKKLTEVIEDQVAEITNSRVDEVINDRMVEYDTAVEVHGTNIKKQGKAIEELQESKQDKLTFDQTPTSKSTNPITSGAVAAAISSLVNAFLGFENSYIKSIEVESSVIDERGNVFLNIPKNARIVTFSNARNSIDGTLTPFKSVNGNWYIHVANWWGGIIGEGTVRGICYYIE